jgi:hypothetical protein
MTKNKVVYWSSAHNNFNIEPDPWILDFTALQKTVTGKNYMACPSIREKHKNTFISRMPVDLRVNFNTDYASDERVNMFKDRGIYENSNMFGVNLSRIFFSPEPQMLEVTPPYLHKTSYSQYGHTSSGSFDIHYWFRPTKLMFQLWPEQQYFSINKDEPFAYYNFPNKDKIVFRQFVMTDKLLEISENNVQYKFTNPRQSLQNLYDMSKKNKIHKTVFAEIKKNLF